MKYPVKNEVWSSRDQSVLINILFKDTVIFTEVVNGHENEKRLPLLDFEKQYKFDRDKTNEFRFTDDLDVLK